MFIPVWALVAVLAVVLGWPLLRFAVWAWAVFRLREDQARGMQREAQWKKEWKWDERHR